MQTKPKFRGYVIAVISAVLMFFLLGSISTSAVFIPAIAKAGRHTLNLIYLMVTFATVSSTVLSMFFAASVISKLTPKWGLLLGSLATAGHFAVYSLAENGPVWWLYVGAVMGGIAMAFGTSACISALISQWFIKDRTKYTGLIFGAASIGMGIWQSIAGYLIAEFGFGQAYLVLAGVVLVVTVPLVLFGIQSPDKLGQKPLGWEEVAGSGQAQSSHDLSKMPGVTLKEAQKTSAYWVLFFGLVCANIAVNAYRYNLTPIMGAAGIEQTVFSNVSAARGVIGALCSMSAGFILAKTGLRKLVTGVSFFGVIALALLSIPNVSLPVYIVSAVCSALPGMLGGVIIVEIVKVSFGIKDFIKINTAMMAATYIGSAVPSLTNSALLTAGISMHTITTIMTVIATLGLILLFFGIKAGQNVSQRFTGSSVN